MPVQRLSHLRPAAMQEHTLVCRADLQQLADLVCAPADESRRVTTARCAGGSEATARSTTSTVSRKSALSSGSSLQRFGDDVQWSAQRAPGPWKRARSTESSAAATSSSLSAEKGTLRPS